MGNYIATTLGIFIFLFLFWRRLKEDYSANVIFSTAFFILSGTLIGFLTSKYFFPVWSFWLEAFGAFLGFSLGIIRFNPRFYETYEATFVALIPWASLFFLSKFIQKPSWLLGIVTFFNFGLIPLFDYLNIHYKSFSWYKSGKIGVSGLLVSGTFFLFRAAIALIFPSMVSFSGRSEVVLSGICGFTIFLLVFNLARDQK